MIDHGNKKEPKTEREEKRRNKGWKEVLEQESEKAKEVELQRSGRMNSGRGRVESRVGSRDSRQRDGET